MPQNAETLEDKKQQNTNLFSATLFIGTLLISALMAYIGAQRGDIGMIFTGILPFLLAAIARWASDNTLLKGGLSFYDEVVAFVFGIGLILVFDIGFNVQFSFFSSATSNYLSSITAHTSEAGEAVINVVESSTHENFLIYGLTLMFIHEVLRERLDWSRKKAAIVGPVPGAIAFMAIHGARQPEFYLLSGGLAMAMFVPAMIEQYVGEEVIPGVELAYTFGAGMHVGLNVSELGGLIEFYRVLGTAEGATVFISWAIYAFSLFIVLYLPLETLNRHTETDLFGWLKGW